MRVAETRESEGRPVMGKDRGCVANDYITLPETEPTSRWCSNARPLVEPMKEAIANDSGASHWCSLPHRRWTLSVRCELAASQYRVGCVEFSTRLRPRCLWGRYRVLEPNERKLSRSVLRGLGASNGPWLLGHIFSSSESRYVSFRRVGRWRGSGFE
jgi:hypothetical protein